MDAYEEGYECFANGGEIEENPFILPDEQHRDWHDGFVAAMNDYANGEL